MAGLFISYSNEKARHDTGKNLYVFASFECFILFFAVLILRCWNLPTYDLSAGGNNMNCF